MPPLQTEEEWRVSSAEDARAANGDSGRAYPNSMVRLMVGPGAVSVTVGVVMMEASETSKAGEQEQEHENDALGCFEYLSSDLSFGRRLIRLIEASLDTQVGQAVALALQQRSLPSISTHSVPDKTVSHSRPFVYLLPRHSLNSRPLDPSLLPTTPADDRVGSDHRHRCTGTASSGTTSKEGRHLVVKLHLLRRHAPHGTRWSIPLVSLVAARSTDVVVRSTPGDRARWPNLSQLTSRLLQDVYHLLAASYVRVRCEVGGLQSMALRTNRPPSSPVGTRMPKPTCCESGH